eukprot:3941678-Rhodomonas_salina.1
MCNNYFKDLLFVFPPNSDRAGARHAPKVKRCSGMLGFPFWVWFLVLRVFLVLVWGMALRACSGAGSGGCRGFYAEYRQNLYEFSP